MMKTIIIERAIQAALIIFLLIFPHFVPLPFYSYSIVCLAAIIIYLKKKKKTLRDLGLQRRGLTVHVFIVGLISGLIWVAFNKWLYHPFITHFFIVDAYTEYDFIRKKLSNLIFTIIAAWVVGGFYEEIVFRGYIQTTIEHWFGRSKKAFWFAAVITSILFGFYHWQQGVFGMVPAGLGGFFWTYLFYRYKRNLWYPIVSHAVYDTVALVMIYFGIVI
jgi:uncharacterized protein